MLRWEPSLRLEAGAYVAQVSPMAGGRLSRLAWQRRGDTIDLLVPAASPDTGFDPDLWPKCGAFPMLPYNNRLRDGSVWWAGRSWPTRLAKDQKHGVHGFGHRFPWQVESHTQSRAALVLEHTVPSSEWPWPFAARIDYGLDAHGLSVVISITNTAPEPAPAAIGWHPYVAGTWRSAPHPKAQHVHHLGNEGLAFPYSAGAMTASRVVRTDEAHTFAFENAPSPWTLSSARGDVLTLNHDSLHVVHHQPASRAYECVEPVTALPGAMAGITGGVEAIALRAGETRSLRCQLEASIGA